MMDYSPVLKFLCAVLTLNICWITGAAPPPVVVNHNESSSIVPSGRNMSAKQTLMQMVSTMKATSFPSTTPTTDPEDISRHSLTTKVDYPLLSTSVNSHEINISEETSLHKNADQLQTVLKPSDKTSLITEDIQNIPEGVENFPWMNTSSSLPMNISSSLSDLKSDEVEDSYPSETFGLGPTLGIILDKEYSPEEIAEYIFWTGDERGVVEAMNDLINDGLMLSQEDTIKFLVEVESRLMDLRNRYQEFLSSTTSSTTTNPTK